MADPAPDRNTLAQLLQKFFLAGARTPEEQAARMARQHQQAFGMPGAPQGAAPLDATTTAAIPTPRPADVPVPQPNPAAAAMQTPTSAPSFLPVMQTPTSAPMQNPVPVPTPRPTSFDEVLEPLRPKKKPKGKKPKQYALGR